MNGRYGLYRRVPRWDIGVEALRNGGFSAENGGRPLGRVGRRLCLLLVGLTSAVTGCTRRTQRRNLRLFSGDEKTVDVYEDFPRYIQEPDIAAQAVSPTDEGIAPITESGDLASLDWRGVEQTDEDRRPDGNSPTTYTRSPFLPRCALDEAVQLARPRPSGVSGVESLVGTAHGRVGGDRLVEPRLRAAPQAHLPAF